MVDCDVDGDILCGIYFGFCRFFVFFEFNWHGLLELSVKVFANFKKLFQQPVKMGQNEVLFFCL